MKDEELGNLDVPALDSLDGVDLEVEEPPDQAEAHANQEEPTTPGKRAKVAHCTEGKHTYCIKRNLKMEYRRAFSESKLLDAINGPLEKGTSYHCITGGDVDALSFLRVILREQPLDYCLFSTWCMARDDILQFREWLIAGKIKRLDCYVGEIFPNSYTAENALLEEVVREHSNGGRICVFRNHAKIFAGQGEKFTFAIETSANINTNPRTENGCISIDDELFRFYKKYFDGIVSFTKTFPDWEPYPDRG